MSPGRNDLGDRVLAADPVTPVREVLGGSPAWVVGGTVRDIALGREASEVDLAVPGPPEKPARQLARARGGVAFELSAEYPAWRVRDHQGRWQVDIATLRGEGGIESDLRLRDFTVNAVAVALDSGEVHDPTGGLRDLADGVLRAGSADSFTDDPLRLMRAARLVSRFGWGIEPATETLARQAAPRAGDPAGERILTELLELLAGPDPVAGITAMDRLDLLEPVLPEIAALHGVVQGNNHHLDVYGHTLEVLAGTVRLQSDPADLLGDRAPEVARYLELPLANGVSRAVGLRLAALFHDCAKPATRSTEAGYVTFHRHDRVGAKLASGRLRSTLRSSRRLAEYVAGLTRNHLLLGFLVDRRPLDRRQVWEYLSATAPDSIDVTLLTVADRLAARGNSPLAADGVVAAHLELAREMTVDGLKWLAAGEPFAPIGGRELADALGREPGPWLGPVLDELAAARYAGELSTVAEAVDRARTQLETD